MNFFPTLILTFLPIFFAEMGDKTMLLVIALSSKYKPKEILTGVSIAVIILNALAVLGGSILKEYIPMDYIKIIAGLMFLVFAVLSLRENKEEEEHLKQFKLPPALAVGVAFFLAELGDKTQIATLNISATAGNSFKAYFVVFLGSTLALISVNTIALIIGHKSGRHIPEDLFRYISVVIFAIFGFITLYNGVLSVKPIYVWHSTIATAVVFAACSYLVIMKQKPKMKG